MKNSLLPLPNGLTSIVPIPPSCQVLLLPAACRYQARRSSRSGQPSFRRMSMRVLPLPPPSLSPLPFPISPLPENRYRAMNPGRRSGS